MGLNLRLQSVEYAPIRSGVAVGAAKQQRIRKPVRNPGVLSTCRLPRAPAVVRAVLRWAVVRRRDSCRRYVDDVGRQAVQFSAIVAMSFVHPIARVHSPFQGFVESPPSLSAAAGSSIVV